MYISKSYFENLQNDAVLFMKRPSYVCYTVVPFIKYSITINGYTSTSIRQ